VWTHTTGRLPLETFKGKVVGVIGAGSSAFDAAAVALESGAEVHLFSRRAYIDYPAPPGAPPPQPAPPVDRGHANVLEQSYELPDAVRWRNFVLGDRRVASVPFDSLQRAVAFDDFHIHLNSSLSEVALAGNGQVTAKVGGRTMRFHHLIAGTGYRIDLAAQPELKNIHEHIARWGDRFTPQPGDESEAGASHPYLGAAMEFLPRGSTGAEYLRNVHCFNLAGALSYGIPVGDVPSTVIHPRLLTAIARDLYKESVDTAVHERFIATPLVAPSAAPYEKAVVGSRAGTSRGRREVA
jgi:cation diffusion facilitator CzcD-associated flavoprotein CzcO